MESNYLSSLKKNGFVVIESFFSQSECQQLEILSRDLMREGLLGESEDLEIDFKDSSYNELAEKNNTILSKRGDIGYDQNFLDFFNPQFWFSRRNPNIIPIIEKFQNGAVPELLKKIDTKLKPKNMNLYCHEGVSSPRTHHIDSIRNYFKVFLALTDQTDDSCGPFALIPGTHKNKVFNYLMCLFNHRILGKKGGMATDATFYKKSKLKPMHLNIGDLLISNQSCVHGAIPATSGKRLTLLQTYDVK
jgi:hypothetical protein|tara:strand:- start:12176 stop:12916 length:741 start_codon:yes stop_codon:yes gene_type:complete